MKKVLRWQCNRQTDGQTGLVHMYHVYMAKIGINIEFGEA